MEIFISTFLHNKTIKVLTHRNTFKKCWFMRTKLTIYITLTYFYDDVIEMKRYEVTTMLKIKNNQKHKKSIADVTSVHSMSSSVWIPCSSISFFSIARTFFERQQPDLQRRHLSSFTIFLKIWDISAVVFLWCRRSCMAEMTSTRVPTPIWRTR